MHACTRLLINAINALTNPHKCSSVLPIYFQRGDNGIFKLNMLFIPSQGSAMEVMEQYNSFLRKRQRPVWLIRDIVSNTAHLFK